MQRLLHAFNVAATVLATAVAMAGWGGPTAKHVAMGAATTTGSIGITGWLVWMIVQGGGETAKAGAIFALVSQMFVVGGVIWILKPEALPFGSGVIAVLGATVVAALIDGMRESRQYDADVRTERANDHGND